MLFSSRTLHQQAKTSESTAITPRTRQQHSPPPQPEHEHEQHHYATKNQPGKIQRSVLRSFREFSTYYCWLEIILF